METTSKMWDLNCEVEFPEKAGFLCYQGAPKLHLERKREKECMKENYLI
jgi:hypothetical protein